MVTWELEYLPLTNELLDEMVSHQWVTRVELELWMQDQLPPAALDRIDCQINLARLVVNQALPMQ